MTFRLILAGISLAVIGFWIYPVACLSWRYALEYERNAVGVLVSILITLLTVLGIVSTSLTLLLP